MSTYLRKFDSALFDARSFVIPKEEVANYFVWRQRDWERNSIQMFGRSMFSAKQLHEVGCQDIIRKCNEEHQKDYYSIENYLKYGTLITSEGAESKHFDYATFKKLLFKDNEVKE